MILFHYSFYDFNMLTHPKCYMNVGILINNTGHCGDILEQTGFQHPSNFHILLTSPFNCSMAYHYQSVVVTFL